MQRHTHRIHARRYDTYGRIKSGKRMYEYSIAEYLLYL